MGFSTRGTLMDRVSSPPTRMKGVTNTVVTWTLPQEVTQYVSQQKCVDDLWDGKFLNFLPFWVQD